MKKHSANIFLLFLTLCIYLSFAAAQAQPLSEVSKILLKRIDFEGNTIFSDEQLGELTASHTNRPLNPDELQEIKRLITGYYVKNGYINSGAVIPDQHVRDGILQINIVEGRLTQLRVTGLERLRPAYVEGRLRHAKEEILNLPRLQEYLKLLEQNPLIAHVKAELSPGVQRGESLLQAKIEEAKPYRMSFDVNNHRSPGVGAWRAELSAAHLNLSGWGDSLGIRYGLTSGLDDYTLTYTVPLNSYNTTLELEAGRSDALIVEVPFEQLNMESETDSYSLHLRHPWRRSTAGELAFGVKLARRQSQTSLLGEPFDFSAGSVNGESTVSVLSLTQEWVSRNIEQVNALRSQINLGLGAMGATRHEGDIPDSRFVSWLGQYQHLRRLNLWDSQVLFRLDVQLSNDALLSLEKFSIGGNATVRGYRENQLTRDNGLIAGLEWRIPVAQWRIPGLSSDAADGVLEAATFVDFGRGWNSKGGTPAPSQISSVGLGLRWYPRKDMNVLLYWGKALRNIQITGEHDLQDEGIHFQIQGRFL